MLRDADWGNQAPLRVAPDGTAEWWPINHGTPQIRSSIVRGVPVSAGPNFVAYRREAYLRLAEGWTCAPPTGPSDAFMWAKFFRLPGLRVASTASTTSIKFPSHIPSRAGLDPDRRLAELKPWLSRIFEPGFVRKLCAKASVRSRLSALYKLHDVANTDSWTQALARCGFSPTSEDGASHPAHDGAPLALPLSDGQQEEADLALQDHLRQLDAGSSK